MHEFKGTAASPNAARVMRRLCKHWSHKFPVTVDETRGVIELTGVRCTLEASPERLDVLLASETEVPERLKGVVAEHLQRMAGEEKFEVVWES